MAIILQYRVTGTKTHERFTFIGHNLQCEKPLTKISDTRALNAEPVCRLCQLIINEI